MKIQFGKYIYYFIASSIKIILLPIKLILEYLDNKEIEKLKLSFEKEKKELIEIHEAEKIKNQKIFNKYKLLEEGKEKVNNLQEELNNKNSRIKNLENKIQKMELNIKHLEKAKLELEEKIQKIMEVTNEN